MDEAWEDDFLKWHGKDEIPCIKDTEREDVSKDKMFHFLRDAID